MKINDLAFQLEEDDIELLVKKILSNDKLLIKSISINDFLITTGELIVKSIKIPFTCKLAFVSNSDSEILIKINSFSTANIPIPKKLRDGSLTLLKNLISSENIIIVNDLIKLNLINILNDFLPVNFTLLDCFIKKNLISVKVSNLYTSYSLDKLLANVI